MCQLLNTRQDRVSIGFLYCSLFTIQFDLSRVEIVRIPNLTLSPDLSLASLLRRLTEKTVGFSIIIEDLQTPQPNSSVREKDILKSEDNMPTSKLEDSGSSHAGLHFSLVTYIGHPPLQSGVPDPSLELVQGLFTPSGMAHRKDNGQETNHIPYLNEVLSRFKILRMLYFKLDLVQHPLPIATKRTIPQLVAPRSLSCVVGQELGCLGGFHSKRS